MTQNGESTTIRSRWRAILFWIVSALGTSSFLVSASYLHARGRAMSLANKGPLQPMHEGLALHVIGATRLWPVWQFDFDPPDMFIDHYLTIQMGITGEVVATRPVNLMEILEEREKETDGR